MSGNWVRDMGRDFCKIYFHRRTWSIAIRLGLSLQLALGSSVSLARDSEDRSYRSSESYGFYGHNDTQSTQAFAGLPLANGQNGPSHLVVHSKAGVSLTAEAMSVAEAEAMLARFSPNTNVTYIGDGDGANNAPIRSNPLISVTWSGRAGDWGAKLGSTSLAEESLKDSIRRFEKTNFIFKVGQVFREKIKGLAADLRSKGLAESEDRSSLWLRSGKVILLTVGSSAIFSTMTAGITSYPAFADGGVYKAVYVLSENLPMITQMFVFGMIVNGFQLITPLWHGYKESGARLAAKMADGVTSALKKTFSSSLVADWGRLGAVAAFNGIVGVGFQYIEGHVSLWMSLLYMLAGSWDTVWELALGKQVTANVLGTRAVEKFTQLRMFMSPLVEPFLWVETPFKLAAASLITVAGILGLTGVFANQKVTQLASRLRDKRKSKMAACDQILGGDSGEGGILEKWQLNPRLAEDVQ